MSIGLTQEEMKQEVATLSELAELATRPLETISKVVESEVTPELEERASSEVQKSISPASAAVMQSVFYKEMMIKTSVAEEETSSLLSSDDESGHCCSYCGGDSTTDDAEESGVDPLSSSKSSGFKSFDLSDFVEEHEGQEVKEAESKEEAINAIIEKLVPEDEGLVKDIKPEDLSLNIQDSAAEAFEVEVIDLDAEEEAPPAEGVQPPELITALLPEQQELQVLQPADQNKENAVEKILVVTPQEPTVLPVHEPAVHQFVITPQLTPAQLQANAMVVINDLEPIFKDDRWLRKQPGVDLRQAMANAGICATQLLMETLSVNPSLYNFRKEDSWFGKNQMNMRGMIATLARIGLVDQNSATFRFVFNSLQRFSGTYIFVRHAYDHGSFDQGRLNPLHLKAIALCSKGYTNPENNRCVAIKKNLLKNSRVLQEHREVTACVMHPYLVVEGHSASMQQPMPLSPRVLNHQLQQVSPRKRFLTGASSSKENTQEAPPPTKRFNYDEAAIAAMRLTSYYQRL